MKKLITLISVLTLLISCTTEVELDLPQSESQIVVEGYIETGTAPFVSLTRSIPFYATIDESSLTNQLVTNADLITVSDRHGNTDTLTLKIIGNYPFFKYEADNPTIIGEEKNRYDLRIEVDGQILTSTTYIPEIIALDSTWFELEIDEDTMQLGSIHANLSDPDTLGNQYKTYFKTLGKDNRFIAPSGSTVNDRFVNGESFPFFYFRSEDPLSTDTLYEPGDPRSFYWSVGDQVVVKYATMDFNTYQFWLTRDSDQQNGGNPFSAPITTVSNIEGGLGVWSGFGVSLDTVSCTID
jgi:hypothetical protein